MEVKTLVVPFEVKEITEKGTFSGYGSTFGNIDSGGDMVIKGAFLQTLIEHKANGTWPIMCAGHIISKEIGEWTDIKEDDHGLWCSGNLWIDGKYPDGDALKAYRGMTKANGKMGLSIGYSFYKGGYEYDEDGNYYKLKNIKLHEVSVTPFPMNTLARVETVKSIRTEREFEKFLRDAGFSRSEATRITSNGYKSNVQGEPDFSKLINGIRKTTQIIKGK